MLYTEYSIICIKSIIRRTIYCYNFWIYYTISVIFYRLELNCPFKDSSFDQGYNRLPPSHTTTMFPFKTLKLIYGNESCFQDYIADMNNRACTSVDNSDVLDTVTAPIIVILLFVATTGRSYIHK